MIKNISVASYSFNSLLTEGMMDTFGYLESMRYRYNLATADIWNGFVKDMSYDDVKKIRKAMDERGIFLANLCCDWAHPWSANPDELKVQHEMADKMLRFAEIMGAKTVRIDLGVREDEITDAQFNYVAEKFAQYAKFGAQAGFVVGPENHWGASRRLDVQLRMHKEISSPNYGMLLHLGNWNLRDGETADSNDLAAASIAVHTHIDYEHALNAHEVLPALKNAGYKGVWGVEHHKNVSVYNGVAAHLAMIAYADSCL